MNALLCVQKSPPCLGKLSPRKPLAPAFHPTGTQTLNNPSSRTWKLHPNAKGFARSTRSIEESAINKTSKTDKNNEEEAIPEEVIYRIGGRILVLVGVPMALGIASLHIFGIIKEQHVWDVPVWIPFTTTLLFFGASTFGIPYGALSASLDPKQKGSFLGFEEARHNWAEMWKEEENDSQ
uniref:Uncharacterized protein n=1 Tax=Rhizophora mucronata TaxID=61149 RepID=A0A2P2JWX7_RHIMU